MMPSVDVEATHRGSDDARGLGSRLPPGALALLAAAGSLVACYGTLFIAMVLDVAMTGWRAHLQALVMWGLGAVVLYALWAERREHGNSMPLAIGAGGVLLILFVLYVHFDQSLEILAYVLLVAAAFLNQNNLLAASVGRVREQAAEIRELNRRLEAKIERQDDQIERLDRLRDFLSPRVAELVVAGGGTQMLASHRRYIACLFCDIRHFTALSEAAEPEDTINVLHDYHERVGRLIDAHNGTLGFRAGDGIMVFFNDPIPCDRPVLDAVRLALDIRVTMLELRQRWEPLGFGVGVGIGMAAGYATLGMIGTTGGAGYTAIGNPVNIAARLCDQAADGEILIEHRAHLDVQNDVTSEAVGALELRGVSRPVETYRIAALGKGDTAEPAGAA